MSNTTPPNITTHTIGSCNRVYQCTQEATAVGGVHLIYSHWRTRVNSRFFGKFSKVRKEFLGDFKKLFPWNGRGSCALKNAISKTRDFILLLPTVVVNSFMYTRACCLNMFYKTKQHLLSLFSIYCLCLQKLDDRKILYNKITFARYHCCYLCCARVLPKKCIKHSCRLGLDSPLFNVSDLGGVFNSCSTNTFN